MAPPEYTFNWHHDVLYRWLNDFAEKRRRRIIIELPPGHGKSEAASRNLPAYILGKNPNARIIACSYTNDLAAEMNRDVQRVMDSERYRGVFPGTLLAGGPKKAGKNTRRNNSIFDVAGHRGYYKSAGVGSGITGRRFDYGLIDDPIKDRETANSPTKRELAWRWYTSVFSTRQAKDAAMLVVMTRWHEDDLVGRLKKKAEDGDGEPWDVLTLPAIAEYDRHPEDIRQPGEALWPHLKSLEELEIQRKLDPRDFAALYQQRPRAEGGTEWPDSYFPPSIWFTDWPSDLTMRGIGLDPSKGKDAKWGDYSALVKMGRDSQGILYVEADLGRWNTDEITARAVEMCREFRPDVFAIEANQFQELLATQIARAGRQSGMPLPVVPMVNTVKKEVRIRRLTPYLAQGVMRFKGGSPGTRLLVQQMKDFPLGDHDDGCLIAGTMIDTIDGLVPIEQIKAGDQVLTRWGYRTVLAAGMTGIRETFTLHADGRDLTGTANHPVFDGHGFVPMLQASIMYVCQEHTLQGSRKSSCSTASTSAATLLPSSGRTRCTTPRMPDTERQEWGHFIRSCGRRLMVLSPRDMKSITEMETRSTTLSAIWSASPKPNTIEDIMRSDPLGRSSVNKPFRLLPNGTDLQKVWPGTNSTGLAHGKTARNQPSSATTVRVSSRHSSLTRPSSVPASAVSDPTPQTVAMRAVPVFARNRCGMRPVFNLSVDGGEYFANGFLVHNCDAVELVLRALVDLDNGRRGRRGPRRIKS